MNQESHERSTGQGSIISLSIKDRDILYATYMPFLHNGGIFMPTARNREIGSQVFLLLTLPEPGGRLAVNGRVVWITPPHAQGNRAPGIGIQFQDSNGTARSTIEHLLGNYMNSDASTHTM